MPFNIGDSAKVKKDIMCPDDDSVSIGGWQGRVFETADDDIVGIRWDSITLKQIPREYIKQSEKEGLGWAEMYLSANEIEPASPLDSEETADHVRNEMESTSLWLDEGEEGERILNVIADAENELEAWDEHLRQVLTFPFDAEVSEPQDRGPLHEDDNIRVQGIIDPDEYCGVLVKVITTGGQHLAFPLCDLTTLDRKSPNYIPVKDYCVWFANR